MRRKLAWRACSLADCGEDSELFSLPLEDIEALGCDVARLPLLNGTGIGALALLDEDVEDEERKGGSVGGNMAAAERGIGMCGCLTLAEACSFSSAALARCSMAC